jgi:hypothetical protein
LLISKILRLILTRDHRAPQTIEPQTRVIQMSMFNIILLLVDEFGQPGELALPRLPHCRA